MRLEPALLDVARGLEDRPHLHLDDLGHDDREADAAQAHHRVGLVHPANGGQQRFLLGQAVGLALDAHPDDLFEQGFLVGHELMQRRVDQADDDGQAGHRLEQAVEVRALVGQQLVQGCGALLARSARIMRCTMGRRSVSKNMCSVRHRPMPCAPNCAGAARVRRVVRVGPHLEAPRRAVVLARLATPSVAAISSAQPSRVMRSVCSSNFGATVGIWPTNASPVPPSTLIAIAFLKPCTPRLTRSSPTALGSGRELAPGRRAAAEVAWVAAAW